MFNKVTAKNGNNSIIFQLYNNRGLNRLWFIHLYAVILNVIKWGDTLWLMGNEQGPKETTIPIILISLYGPTDRSFSCPEWKHVLFVCFWSQYIYMAETLESIGKYKINENNPTFHYLVITAANVFMYCLSVFGSFSPCVGYPRLPECSESLETPLLLQLT